MDTLQIQHALQDVNSFLGVYASDLLPLSIVQAGTIIVNTDPHTEPGLNWQAIYFQNPHRTSNGYFFDSYGRYPFIPSSKISYDAIVQSGNTTERNSKDLPLQSVANIAASSLYTWTGAAPRNNLWACLLLKTPTETYTSYSGRNLALRYANSALEGNAIPAYINGELLTLIVLFYMT